MIVNRPRIGATVSNHLGAYLRDRRARLDPEALGLAPARRRTPGLRREEVAQRAHISTAWYTFLTSQIGALVDDLRDVSPIFRTMWADQDVREDDHGRVLTIDRPFFGQIELEHTRFAIDGRPDFTMIVHHPLDTAVRVRMQELLRSVPDSKQYTKPCTQLPS